MVEGAYPLQSQQYPLEASTATVGVCVSLRTDTLSGGTHALSGNTHALSTSQPAPELDRHHEAPHVRLPQVKFA